MTLRFAEIQQELKVAAAECRAAYEYKRFVHAYKPALDLSDQAMLSVFRDNSVGDTGTSAYAAFKAQLVSNSLLRSARNKAAFCAEARSEFSAAFSGEGSLESLISSSQPYVDIPFKDCAEAPASAPAAPTLAQRAAPPAVGRQTVQVASANLAQTPVAPPAIRPDPWAVIAPAASATAAADLAHVVPHHAPLVPALPALSRPAAAALSAPQFDLASPPPVAFARVVPHDAPLVPALPQMTRPAMTAAAAPQFDVAPPPAMFARVVPHHARLVPSVPALMAPETQAAAAPRFAIAAETEPVVIARVVPHHHRFVPAVPRMTMPQEQAAAAPNFAISRETPPVAVARVEEPVLVRREGSRHAALRTAGLVLFHPRASMEAPQIEVARAAPPPARTALRAAASAPHEAPDSAIARGLARLSSLAAAMIKREAAAAAAESAAQTRPMVAAVRPAARQANTDVASGDDLAIAAGRAADILHSEPDPHPERRVAARQPANVGTTHRRMVAATLVLPARRGIPLSALNPTIEAARVDQVAQAHPVPAPGSFPAETLPSDQSAVVVAARADMPASKLTHGFSAGKATTYGLSTKPAVSAPRTNDGGGANNTMPAAPLDAPSAALMPQGQDQDQNSNPDQNDDQQSVPNGNQDDQYGPAYAYDDGYARARARARAWRRRIIDAYETYRRRSVPDDYSGDYPPPPPSWHSDQGNDSWSDQ